jgi:hypothetical protein
MVRFRIGWLVAVVAIVGMGAAACKKKDDAKNAASSDGKLIGPPGQVAAASDDLALLPADSEVVLGFNFAQLQQSALWKEYSPKLKEKMSGGLAEMKAACGFDPLDALKSFSIGMRGLDGGKPDGVLVVHGPSKAKVMGCSDKLKAEAAKNGSEVVIDGDVFTVKDKSGSNVALTFVNETTMVGVIGEKGTKEGVKAALSAGSGLKSSSAFMEMHSKIKPGQSLWMLINGNSPALGKASAMGVKPKAVFGSLNVTDGLALDLRVRLGTPEEATQLVNMAKAQTGNAQVKAMFDTLDVATEGSDAKVTVAMSNQKLKGLIGMVGGMLGGMLGGAIPAQN